MPRKSQLDQFKEAACEIGMDEGTRFQQRLKKLVKWKPNDDGMSANDDECRGLEGMEKLDAALERFRQ